VNRIIIAGVTACRILAIRKEDQRFSTFDIPQFTFNRVVHRIVDAGAGAGVRSPDRKFELSPIVGEFAQVMNTTIKRHNHYSILAPELSDERDRRVLNILNAAHYARTHVEHKHDAERDFFSAKVRYCLLHTVFVKQKIPRG
jgi:hypothetical protein